MLSRTISQKKVFLCESHLITIPVRLKPPLLNLNFKRAFLPLWCFFRKQPGNLTFFQRHENVRIKCNKKTTCEHDVLHHARDWQVLLVTLSFCTKTKSNVNLIPIPSCPDRKVMVRKIYRLYSRWPDLGKQALHTNHPVKQSTTRYPSYTC